MTVKPEIEKSKIVNIQINYGIGKVKDVSRYVENVPCKVYCLFGCNSDFSGLKIPKKVSGLLIIDTSVLVSFHEVLGLIENVGFIISLSSLRYIQLHNRKLYRKLKKLFGDPVKSLILFQNEFHENCIIQQKENEKILDFITRQNYIAANFYYSHLNSSKKVALLTDNSTVAMTQFQFTARRLGSDNSAGVEIMSVNEYLDTYHQTNAPAKELVSSLETAILASKMPIDKTDAGKPVEIEDYYPDDMLKTSLKSDDFVKGILRVNKFRSREEAEVVISEGNSSKQLLGNQGKVLIVGEVNRNRSIDGDSVIIKIYPESQWIKKKQEITGSEAISEPTVPVCDETESLSRADKCATGHVVGIHKRKLINGVRSPPLQSSAISSPNFRTRWPRRYINSGALQHSICNQRYLFLFPAYTVPAHIFISLNYLCIILSTPVISDFLDMITLFKNKLFLHDNVNPKDRLYETFSNGHVDTHCFVSLVTRALSEAKDRILIKPQCPWTMAIFRASREFHDAEHVKLNSKFEVEILYPNLKIDFVKSPTTNFFNCRSVRIENSLCRTLPNLLNSVSSSMEISSRDKLRVPGIYEDLISDADRGVSIGRLGNASAGRMDQSCPAFRRLPATNFSLSHLPGATPRPFSFYIFHNNNHIHTVMTTSMHTLHNTLYAFFESSNFYLMHHGNLLHATDLSSFNSSPICVSVHFRLCGGSDVPSKSDKNTRSKQVPRRESLSPQRTRNVPCVDFFLDRNNSSLPWLQFHLRWLKANHINDSFHRASSLLNHLPSNLRQQISTLSEILTAPDPYDQLYAAVLQATTPSLDGIIQKFFNENAIGTQKPSDFLRSSISQLSSLGVTQTNNADLIRRYFILSLPSSIRALLTVVDDSTPIDKLAIIADKCSDILKSNNSPPVVAVSTTSHNTTDTAELNYQLTSMQTQFNNLQNSIAAITAQLNSLSVPRRNAFERDRSQSRRSFRSKSPGQMICYYHNKFNTRANKCHLGCRFL